MRKSMDRTGRGVVCAPASLALPAALSSAAAAPTSGKSARIPRAERFHVTRHGGIARAANSPAHCAAAAGRTAHRCAAARPDTVARRRGRAVADGFRASAEVTGPVRTSGPGACTGARIPRTKSPSTAGARGGRTPVTVYGNEKEPVLRIAIRDRLHSWEAGRRTFNVRIGGRHRPVNSHDRSGAVAYDGFRGRGNDARTVRSGRRRPLTAHHSANPANEVMTSAGTGFGRAAARRPAYPDTLGCDSDVFGIAPAPRAGADRLAFRFPTRHPGYPLGALFVQADTRH